MYTVILWVMTPCVVWYRGIIISEDHNPSILMAEDSHNEKMAGFI
jgi:hypothetical protein